MERKIGEIFNLKNQIIPLIVVRKSTSNMIGCKGCVFKQGNLYTSKKSIAGRCGTTTRQDGIRVIFKQAYKFMNTNELKIIIPEGMVIDVANSDLSNGIIKFKRQCPTYTQIDEHLLRNNLEGRLSAADFHNNSYFRNLAKLFNISLYFNNASVYTGNKYRIFKGINGYYTIITDENGMPYFNSEEDAKLVIDNFKGILDSIFE